MNKSKDSNLIHATLQELLDLGYKPVPVIKDKKGLVQPPPAGSLLCLTNKAQDLWAELCPSDIKASKVTPDKFQILSY